MTMQAEHGTEEQHGLEPMQYIWIGVALTLITVVELGASLWVELGDALIPILVVLSAVKFVAVVAFYMHLRFENRLLMQVFAGSFALGGFVLLALITLFWTDITDII
jgi:cytochrome c oxidase subunit 4